MTYKDINIERHNQQRMCYINKSGRIFIRKHLFDKLLKDCYAQINIDKQNKSIEITLHKEKKHKFRYKFTDSDNLSYRITPGKPFIIATRIKFFKSIYFDPEVNGTESIKFSYKDWV